jgi:hypothetical protein
MREIFKYPFVYNKLTTSIYTHAIMPLANYILNVIVCIARGGN